MIDLDHLQKLPTEDWRPRREKTGAESPLPRSCLPLSSDSSPSRDVTPGTRLVPVCRQNYFFVVLVFVGIENSKFMECITPVQVSTIPHITQINPSIHIPHPDS